MSAFEIIMLHPEPDYRTYKDNDIINSSYTYILASLSELEFTIR